MLDISFPLFCLSFSVAQQPSSSPTFFHPPPTTNHSSKKLRSYLTIIAYTAWEACKIFCFELLPMNNDRSCFQWKTQNLLKYTFFASEKEMSRCWNWNNFAKCAIFDFPNCVKFNNPCFNHGQNYRTI